ncbi:serine/arginine repetitive matrix protein 2-like [Amphibalanus amphitrite]|uniref:serine/arginine repetitive matrix protein 2-like n=1 Tax=Amphibalanus amphitrite TaxID=1232801 RepID=UPI001C900B34|nr:serine/arginine repetitive matrix protein 2-like [Amphibalanus amphitrite]XP_043213746.1 serine/arginine repetitive matrix protein 2-like [Amphibalanus amphitrite]
MPTSSPSNVTPKENPPNSSATPTAKAPPTSSAATAKEKDKKPASVASGKGSMGARLSTTPGSAGKAPSTASASSTHTASTVPADTAEAKAKSKSGGGVASFLRRKPSSKESAASTSSGAGVKKESKRGVGSSLRTSLFKRNTKSKNGTDAPAPAASPATGASTSSSTSAAAEPAGASASTSSASTSKPPSGASAPAGKDRASPEKGRVSPTKGRASPEKGRTSPEKGRTSPDKSPAGRGASPPKTQRPSSRTDASPGDSTKKSPSPRLGGAAAAGRSNQALTPERKEALKKQWFTDGKPLPEPAGRGRATSKTGAGSAAGSRTEPRSRPGPGETVGPPAAASRSTGSAFNAAAAKFGGVKTPAKPRPGSPKKSDKSPTNPKKATETPGSPKKTAGASSNPKKSVGAPGSPKKSERAAENPKKSEPSPKPEAAKGLDDLMDAMSGFNTEAGNTNGANTKEEKDNKSESKPPTEEELVTSTVSSSLNAKSETKAPAVGGGLDDLMGAMEGFNPDGSKTNESNKDSGISSPDEKKTDSGISSPDEKKTDAEKGDNKESSVVSVKDESRTSDEKGGAKGDNVKTNDEKQRSVDVKKDDKHEDNNAKNAVGSDAKAGSGDSEGKDKASDPKADDFAGDALEPKAEKTSTWRHGDTDSGELGLGGISQKEREERAHRPSAPKDETADLDFLMGQIDTAPKPPTSKTKTHEKEHSPKAQKKPAEKDAGLDDLMDLAKGFDMSAMPKSEPVVAKASAAPEVAPSDMDKFLDMMDTVPEKRTAAPTGPPVDEEQLMKKDTWRTGDGDDEAMIALMNKPRDKDAPSQAPDWDIDDLLVGEVTKKSDAKQDSAAPEKETPVKKPDAGAFSGFDDFIGDSLSGDGKKDKPAESLSGKDAASVDDSKKDTDRASEDKLADKNANNKSTDKKPSSREFAAFDDFLSGSLDAAGDKNKAADKPEEVSDKKSTGGELSAFDDFLSSSLSGKESASGLPVDEPVAAPKKASAVDSAPPVHAEEEIVSAVSASQTTAAPAKPKPALDKHISKEGDTRGSVPEHGHGLRDLLYDDKDKTGTKPSAPREDPKSREPAVLDDLIRPAKASTTASAPPSSNKEETIVAQAASTTEAAKPSGKKVTDEHREKPGNTRGSVPDHGHGVRDVLYDDSDKTGRRKSGSKDDSKSREPAPLEDLIQPKKAAASHAAPGEAHAPSSGDEDEEEESISAETAHQTQASGQAGGKKKRRSRKKKHAKEGDTRGSVPDHGHGVRDVLYDDSDKTGRKKTPSESKSDDKHREPAALDDLIQPKKAAVSHAAPAARSSSPESKQTEEAITASTAHESQAAAPASGKKANKKKQAKEGDTRGSVPDHGHGVRDVLYDDKDKTGRRKSESKDDSKARDPAPLDDLIQPKKAAVSHAAAPAKKSSSRSPSPEEEEEDEISAETAHQSQAAGQSGGKKKRRSRKKKHAKEGDTRGSVPDHGHGVRDVLYDDSDKTGQKKSDTKQDTKRTEPEPLEDLIRPAQASHTASAPPSSKDGSAASPTGAEQPLVAERADTTHSAPPAAARASPERQEPARKSLSLAGMTDPDQEDSDDGEELRRLIASTEALQAQLYNTRRGDSKQAEAVQQETVQELERLERSLEQRERRLESAGRGQEVKAAKEGLQKVKEQLDVSRAETAAKH